MSSLWSTQSLLLRWILLAFSQFDSHRPRHMLRFVTKIIACYQLNLPVLSQNGELWRWRKNVATGQGSNPLINPFLMPYFISIFVLCFGKSVFCLRIDKVSKTLIQINVCMRCRGTCVNHFGWKLQNLLLNWIMWYLKARERLVNFILIFF